VCVCVCVITSIFFLCVYVCAHSVFTYVCMCVFLYNMCAICTYVCVCVCVSMCVCVHVCVCVYAVCMSLSVSGCLRVSQSMHAHTFGHIHALVIMMHKQKYAGILDKHMGMFFVCAMVMHNMRLNPPCPTFFFLPGLNKAVAPFKSLHEIFMENGCMVDL
jgi:hypothetical protein